MSFNRSTMGVLAVVACIGGALACGPNFPWQLLDNRGETTSDPVTLSFPWEAARLVTVPRDGLRAVESVDPTYGSGNTPASEPEAVVVEREEARGGNWSALVDRGADAGALVAELEAARTAVDGEAALVAGAGLPAAVLNYIAGAVEFRAGRFDAALKHFEAVERLPPQQRQIRAVAAAYMQGRVRQQLGEMGPARAAFQLARRYAEAGAPDPMGLAVASLGEEARVDLVEGGMVEAPWPVDASGADDAKAVRLTADAVRLYAEQAARGSKMALLSLREVAERLVGAEHELKITAADPLVRRLLVAYVVGRDGDYPWDNGVTAEQIERVIDAITSHPMPGGSDDLDRLAALAYMGGRYELAERLTSSATRPLGRWIRAKLELRRGDRDAAARDWMAALTEQAATATLDEPARIRLRGEAAVIRLSQGEYGESLRLLFPVAGTYWGDVAYVAERVLTVDELKALVDGLPRAPRPATSDAVDSIWSRDFVPADRLRLVLARRLVRDGRAGEAIAYFPTPVAGATADRSDSAGATVEEAREYVAALEAASPAGRTFDWPWLRVARAEALFKVATLDREQGMKLRGTEGPPDEAVLSGSFAYGIGQANPEGRSSSSALLGPDETSRFAASAPRPDNRFHYRGVAADRAAAAADLLPQRSQAYAATLCWATRWAIENADQAKADVLYRRYVANGAYQKWAGDFGQICPDPDFEGARTFWWRRIESWVATIAGFLWRHVTLIAVLAIAAALLAAMVLKSRAMAARHS